jgi:hypothetical protein
MWAAYCLRLEKQTHQAAGSRQQTEEAGDKKYTAITQHAPDSRY